MQKLTRFVFHGYLTNANQNGQLIIGAYNTILQTILSETYSFLNLYFLVEEIKYIAVNVKMSFPD